ncbi:ATP-binding protein, partial [Listeria monocytogenes]|nr:ATP-binding protein [Listeria monocytogenes]
YIDIVVEFKLDADDDLLTLDSTAVTSFTKECLLNSSKNLELILRINIDKDATSVSVSSIMRLIRCEYFKIYKDKPLILMKNSELKKCIKEEIGETKVDTKINHLMREELHNNLNDKEKVTVEMDINSLEGAKKTWGKISEILPVYQIFRVDRSNNDGDKDVQDPIKAVTAEATKNIEKDFERISEHVLEEVNKMLEKTIEKMKEFSEFSESNLKPVMTVKKIDSLFSFNIDTDEGIPLNKRGSGVRRLVLLSYFRAEVERLLNKSAKKSVIYAIEEPETSQHPNYQKMIIESLIEIAGMEKRQVIVTTHSSDIAGLLDVDNINLIEEENKFPTIKEYTKNEKATKIIESLGELPPIVNHLVVVVEGENDRRFLSNIGKIEEFRELIDIDRDISIVCANGSYIENWIKRSYLDNSKIPVLIISDNDVDKYSTAIKEMKSDENITKFATLLSYQTMENYVPTHLINKYFNIELNDTKEIKVNDIVANINDIKKNMSKKEIKRALNDEVILEVTKEDLIVHGVYDECLNWFKMMDYIKNKNYEEAQNIIDSKTKFKV